MKFYTVIATLAAAVLGTASSAHAAAAATTTLSGEEEAPNLRRIDEMDDRELFNRGKGQDGTPWAAGRGKGPNKEEEGGPLVINLTFKDVPDNDPAANADIIKELLTNKVVTIDGKSVVLGDVDVEEDDDVNTFRLGFRTLRRSLQGINGALNTLNNLITVCRYYRGSSIYIPFDTVEECVNFYILFALEQYEKTLGVLGFAEPSRG